jgi:hypothetical protein
MKNKVTVESQYTAATIYLPAILFVLYFLLVIIVWHLPQPHPQWLENLELAMFRIFYWVPNILIPILVNLVFGPSLLAYWENKKSRRAILALNLVDLGLIWATFSDPRVYLFYSSCAGILLLWVWAILSKPEDSSEAVQLHSLLKAKYGFAWIVAIHLAAVALIHYKTPERIAAEEMLKYKTIKWVHDGKTEYFNLYSGSDPYKIDLYRFAGEKYETPNLRIGQSEPVDLIYDNNGLKICVTKHINKNGKLETKYEWEFISYEKLFRSEEVELLTYHTAEADRYKVVEQAETIRLQQQASQEKNNAWPQAVREFEEAQVKVEKELGAKGDMWAFSSQENPPAPPPATKEQAKAIVADYEAATIAEFKAYIIGQSLPQGTQELEQVDQLLRQVKYRFKRIAQLKIEFGLTPEEEPKQLSKEEVEKEFAEAELRLDAICAMNGGKMPANWPVNPPRHGQMSEEEVTALGKEAQRRINAIRAAHGGQLPPDWKELIAADKP